MTKAGYKGVGRAIAGVCLLSIIFVTAIYWLSWEISGHEPTTSRFDSAHLEFVASLKKQNDFFDTSTFHGAACSSRYMLHVYEMEKDHTRNSHRHSTLYANLAHTNALFLTILFMVVSGTAFSIFQLATAYTRSTEEVTSSEIILEAANIKLKTGYVSIAMSLVAIAALSYYLPNAHEVRELVNPTEIAELDLSGSFHFCDDLAKARSQK